MPYDATLIAIEGMEFTEPSPIVLPDSVVLISIPESERELDPGVGAATIAMVTGLPSDQTRFFLKEELREIKMSRRS